MEYLGLKFRIWFREIIEVSHKMLLSISVFFFLRFAVWLVDFFK